ncbi:hypothetical protein OAA99_01790 [Omnitrophica bacterium]|nr:hypothetical protein [Candidatus Omnitrophota bacterium]
MRKETKVHVLTPNNGANSFSFIYPILANKRALLERGIEFKFFCPFKSNFLGQDTCDISLESGFFKDLYEGDFIFIDSKFFKFWWRDRRDDIYKFLETSRKLVRAVLWFDTSDSTGTTNFQVLPYVDGYYKNQILKDRRMYLRNYYLSRIFSDYYHNKYGISDEVETGCEHPLSSGYMDKIYVSWNWGLNNLAFSVMGPKYSRLKGNMLSRLRRFSPVIKYWGLRFTPVGAPKEVDISVRLGMEHPRNFVRFHRELLLKRLEKFNVDTSLVDHRRYYNELKKAKLSISPFGLGEICYRDFEIIICGALLIKPDMGHVETWPNIYMDNETYVKCDWDFSDIEEKIEDLRSDPKKIEYIAAKAQDNYQDYLFGKGRPEFCDRVERIVKRHTHVIASEPKAREAI